MKRQTGNVKRTSLYSSPNALAPHYSRFQVDQRLLLTGHSHQAWPDVGFEAQQQAWIDAAEFVDEKWERAFAKAARVRRGFARLLDDTEENFVLGANTHELVVRLLSALPLQNKPRIVTTDGEFHSLRRQLDRLAEERVDVVKVPASPASEIAQRLIETTDEHTALVAVSAVLFQNAHIVPDLDSVAVHCDRLGVPFLVDAYHAINVVPFTLRETGLTTSFVVGGGYKYCQLGEGNCFLRVPENTALRPVVTGWFAEFDELEQPGSPNLVAYPTGPGRFAGSTYDPTSHYRAAKVQNFFEEHGLTVELLREVSQHQVGLLQSVFDAQDIDPSVIVRDRAVALPQVGGFLALTTSHAAALSAGLRDRGVRTDFRGNILRFGPAPYVSDEQISSAISALKEAAATPGR